MLNNSTEEWKDLLQIVILLTDFPNAFFRLFVPNYY